MASSRKIIVSAPCKVHLLGEHAVVYGKPAILASVNLRVSVTVSKPCLPAGRSMDSVKTDNNLLEIIQKVVDPIVKKHLKLKILPVYQAAIDSDIPIGSGLGSSAAICAAYIGALLSYLRVGWNLNLINNLTNKAERVFHGNPSGADSATVIYGGLIWFRKETEEVKLIHQLPFSITNKLARNFVLINTGKPKETTLEMVNLVKNLLEKKPKLVEKFLEAQEQLVKELPLVLQNSREKDLIRIIREGESNLESIGVVSKEVLAIIRNIESKGGAAKICGGGGKTGPTGVLLCYHPNPSRLLKIAKEYDLKYFKTTLGGGIRKENV